MSTLLLVVLLLLIDAIKSQLPAEHESSFTIANGSHPNIIFILTDDWGINDVGWTHDNTDTLTPYLDNLAKTEGLILTNYYAERVCTASRAAFLTGRYPSNLGLQSGVCAANQPASLTRQVSMLSNEFQSSGYTTHLIGKWHLGMISYEYTPTYRGFDSFYGFWAGGEDYFSHESWSFMRQVKSTDLFINEKPALYEWGNIYGHPYDGIYGLWWQKAEALKLLQSKVLFPETTAPFFFYFSIQASHSPRQAPAQYMALYENGPFADNNNRLTFQAQTTTADDTIRDIIEYLKRSQLWLNTLVIITSDNGAKRHFGDNAPYRGFKNTSWEGGVKVPGFITGGYLNEKQRGKNLNYPMHIIDWYPTLLSVAGLDINYKRSKKLYEIEENFDPIAQIFLDDMKWEQTQDIELDGIDMWDYISGYENGIDSEEYFNSEREILLDLKEVWCPFSSCGAIRIGKFKFIRGNNIASLLPDYSDGDKWFRGYAKNNTKAEIFCTKNANIFLETHGINSLYHSFEINSIACVNTVNGCLFDLQLDPCEYYDLSKYYPDLITKFKQRLDEFQYYATVPLMGENNANELFGKDIIQPDRVCHNPTFWCPFKRYKDIQFEYKLKWKTKDNYNQELKEKYNNNNNNNSNVLNLNKTIIYVVIPVCIFIVIIGFLIYCCYCKRRQVNERIERKRLEDDITTEIIDDISEVQPLNPQNRNSNTRIVNIGNGNSNGRKIDYGSTD